MSKTKGVASVLPIQYSEDGKAAVFQVILTDDPYSIEAIDNVKGPVRETANNSIPGDTVLVGGTTSQLVDVQTALAQRHQARLPLGFGDRGNHPRAAAASALGAGSICLIGVVLTYAATIGAIVFVFLDGAGFAGLDFTIPIIVYLFVMAIGTDYNILISSRLREEFKAGLPPREAVRVAVVQGAPAVSAAGLILAGPSPPCFSPASSCSRRSAWPWPWACSWPPMSWPPGSSPRLAAIRGWHFWWPHEMHSRTAPTKTSCWERALPEGTRPERAPWERARRSPPEESAAP